MKQDKIHEAVCKAAGWEAYCKMCHRKLQRVASLGGGASACPDPDCPSHIHDCFDPSFYDEPEEE